MGKKGKKGGKKNIASDFPDDLKSDTDHPWLVSTIASAHQTNQRSLLYETRKPTLNEMYVRGHSISSIFEVELVGKVKGRAWIGKKVIDVELHNVMYAPEAEHNLYSVCSMPEDNQELFTGNRVIFQNKDGPYMEGYKNETKYLDNYSLHFKPTPNPDASFSVSDSAQMDNLAAQLKRSVHISSSQIQQTARKESVIGLPPKLKFSDPNCKQCCQEKAENIGPLTSNIKDKFAAPGEVVNLFFCKYELVHQKSQNLFLIKDQVTSFRKIYFPKSKADLHSKFLLFQNELKLETGNSVRKVRITLHSELLTEQMKNLFDKQGIIVEHVISLEKNEDGEPEDFAILVRGLSLLVDSPFDDDFWDEAVQMVVYELNRTSPGNNQVTPYQGWFGVKPPVQRFNIFGAKAKAILKNSANGKFEDVYILGYDKDNDNLFRCYDPKSKTVETFAVKLSN